MSYRNFINTKVGLLGTILLFISACSSGKSFQYPITPSPQPLTIPTDQFQYAITLLDNPEPAVDFVDFLEPYPGQRGRISQRICIQVRPEIIYEPGDVATYGMNSTRFQLFVDGVELPFAEANPMERGFDPKYDPVAKTPYYEGYQTGCLPFLISPGLHIAKISAVSSSGNTFSYTWAFRADTLASLTPYPNERSLGYFYATVSARLENKQFDDPYIVKLATQIAKQPTPTPSDTPSPTNPFK